MVKKVISGGQTGADRIGLQVAKYLEIPTGGTAPKDFKTENGYDWTLCEIYGLVDDASYDYGPRTLKNVQDADGTVLFGDENSPGSKLTKRLCKSEGKPIKINPTAEELRAWITENNIQTLNVAGNRASKLTTRRMIEIQMTLTDALRS